MKIGERIKNLRELSNLTQEELADRAGLTKGFISQIERDLTSISLDSLIQILEALDENISDFFRESSAEKIVYRETDRVAIEKEKIQRFELLVPGSTNRRLEPILLTLRKGQVTPKERPHEGEEFGFVLRGKSHPSIWKRSRSNSRRGNVSICRRKRNTGFRIRVPRKRSSSGSPLPPVFKVKDRMFAN